MAPKTVIRPIIILFYHPVLEIFPVQTEVCLYGVDVEKKCYNFRTSIFDFLLSFAFKTDRRFNQSM